MNRYNTFATLAPRQAGQSTTEYMVVCVALVLALFAAGTPAGRELADAVRDFYAGLTFFLSLP
jgi:hypothetical protein